LATHAAFTQFVGAEGEQLRGAASIWCAHKGAVSTTPPVETIVCAPTRDSLERRAVDSVNVRWPPLPRSKGELIARPDCTRRALTGGDRTLKHGEYRLRVLDLDIDLAVYAARTVGCVDLNAYRYIFDPHLASEQGENKAQSAGNLLPVEDGIG